MKLKNFFWLLVASIAFAACSGDDLTNDDDDRGIVTDPKGNAWLALSIKSPGQLTRGLHNPETSESGSEPETAINSVKAIFFNGPNGTSVVTRVIDLSAVDAGSPTESSTTRSKAFQIPATSKTMLIIANPKNLPGSIVEGVTTYDQINAAVTETSILTTVAKPNEFLMTNAKGDLEPSDASGNTTTLTLYNSETNAQNSPQEIYIDRVVAKVRVFTGSATSTTATISNIGWLLNVTNNKYFPVAKRIKTWNENPANAGARGTCITPFDRYKIGSYRIDPNYSSSNIGTWNATNPTAYEGNYTYYSSASTIDPSDWEASGNSVYCLENTQEEAYNVHAYTTQVLLKAVFAPKGILQADNTTTNVVSGTDWMIIGGGYYTYATLMGWLKKELTNKYLDGSPDTYNTPLTDAFNAYLAALHTDVPAIDEVSIPTADDFANAPGTPSAADFADDIVEEFQAYENPLKTHGADSRVSVTYYSGGVSYYKIMIKHDDTNAAYNKFGEFGVVRNSVYNISVNSFNNPGYPVIPDPEPGKPDEEEDAWLSIKINVNPWTWYTQNEDL